MYTLGSSADPAHVLRDPASVGAELVEADRGGDVTYHGPGQLVGYPIVSLAEWRAGPARRRRVRPQARGRADRGARRLRHRRDRSSRGYTGVWVGDEKIAAIGVRVARGPHPPRLRAQRRSRPLDVRAHRPVRHPRPRRHVDGAAARAPRRRCATVVDRVVARFAEAFGMTDVDRQDVAWRRVRRPRAVHARAAAGRARATARPARGGRRREQVDPARTPARVDEGARPLRRRVPRAQAARARPRPAHGVRRGRLPEHLRVLGRPHRHVHDPRRSLHACVRVLPGRHAQAARASTPTSRAGSPTRSPRSASRTS